ncbi:MAG: ECF transporter S component [Oscillospiraceae bacterium]|jgi:uncharacterized membrane protein|nr:ECF transporter S component [Oscillospiraceae bacterium]
MKQMFFGRADARRLVTLALLLAVMLVLAYTPLGFIAIGPSVSATLTFLPVLIGTLCEGLGAGLLLGLCFGIISLLKALAPVGVLDVLFLNPLVSVLPRLLIPCGTWGAYKGMRLLRPGRGDLLLAWAGGALAGALTNTVAVLGMLWLCRGAQAAANLGIAPGALAGVMGAILLSNGVPEAVCATILVPVIVRILSRAGLARMAHPTAK